MIHPPKTLAEAKKYRYGEWAGNPKGDAYDPACCAYEYWPKGEWVPHQCTRPNGHGPAGLYCKQHAKKVEERT